MFSRYFYSSCCCADFPAYYSLSATYVTVEYHQLSEDQIEIRNETPFFVTIPPSNVPGLEPRNASK